MKKKKFEAFGFSLQYPKRGYGLNISMRDDRPYADREVFLTFEEEFDSWLEVEEFTHTPMFKKILAAVNCHLLPKQKQTL